MSETIEAPAATAPMTPAAMIDMYVKLRDRVAAVKKAQAATLKPYTDAMDKLEGLLLAHIQANGGKSFACDEGTAYTVTHTSATVNGWSQTLDWIRDHEAWELLEARVSKTAVLAITQDLEEKWKKATASGETTNPAPETIPGVVIRQELALNVRRS